MAEWFKCCRAFGNPIKHSHSVLKYQLRILTSYSKDSSFFFFFFDSSVQFGENEPPFASLWGGEMKDTGDEIGSPLHVH